MLSSHTSRRRLIQWVSLAVLLASVQLAGSRAEAHAIIVSSKPAANSTVTAGPVDIVLRFNSLIDASLSRVDVVDAGGKIIAATIADQGKGVLTSQVTVEVPGKWRVRWQVLSTDGHITRGEIPFTVVAKTTP
jgi:methionine-rich copper-binding protein CopC